MLFSFLLPDRSCCPGVVSGADPTADINGLSLAGDEPLSGLYLTIPLDDMDSFATSFTDSNGKTWNGLYLDNDDNGYVNNGDTLTIYSPDTTDLYFTCVELHDNYVEMYTGDTPNMMTLPGFTAILSLIAVIAAFVAIARRD